MQIPPSVLSATRKRLDFDPNALRDATENLRPVDMNSPARLKEWLGTAATDQARTEGFGLERILGGNDLQQINYLERGLDAAKSVGRINIADANGQTIGYGTGFLIGPRLLLTNHHVLEDANIARHSFVEFNYQLDVKGGKTVQDAFDLDPDACFITDAALDFSVVAVKTISDRRTSLDKYGFVKLDPTPGKTLNGQYLTIIQHPSGQRKQIAIRENRLLKTIDNFLWYATDTAPGSSGSCVFNDSWQVVALHHSGVPATDADGNYLATNGQKWEPSMGDDMLQWIANEGVRISSIVVELQKHLDNPLIAQLLGTAKRPARAPEVVLPTPGPGVIANVAAFMTDEKISIDPNYDNRHGYDAAFLGTGDKRVPLPRLTAEQIEKAAKKVDDGEHVLDYHHYSAVVNGERKLAYYTAVNIDGGVSFKLKRDRDAWYFDPRIPIEAQAGDELYANNDFDRGHLVRRLDPAWGETRDVARVANDDTFHFTNCSPQHKDFNQGQNLWAGLEDYILNHADNLDLKVSVFTGPVFRDDDAEYRGVRIPKEFWKVVAMRRASGQLSATAYVVSQARLIAGIDEAEFTFGKYKTFQVPIAKIEQLTGLNFGKLRAADPLKRSGGAEEAEVVAKAISDYAQIAL